MNVVIILCIAFIPLIAIFICMTLLSKDFSILRGLSSCALGLISVIPIAVMQFFIGKSDFFGKGSLPVMLLEALVLNGLIEESIKMAVLFILPVKKMKQHDFLLCAILLGLTIASFENIVYMIGGLENIVLRLATAVLIHILCAILGSLFVYSAKKGQASWPPFIMAIIFHGVYDYFAMFPKESPFFYFSFAVIIFAAVECKLRYSTIKEKLQNSLDTQN